MTHRAEAVLREALDLPEQERTEIASALLESVGPEQEADVEEAWRQEVTARVATLDAEEVETTSWDDIRNGFLARLSERRAG